MHKTAEARLPRQTPFLAISRSLVFGFATSMGVFLNVINNAFIFCPYFKRRKLYKENVKCASFPDMDTKLLVDGSI